MLRSHRIALCPAGWQDLLFRQHAGYARYAFNWAIGEFSVSLSVGDWCERPDPAATIQRRQTSHRAVGRYALPKCQQRRHYRCRTRHRGLGTVSAGAEGRSEAGTEDRFSEIQKAGRPHGISRR